LVDSGDVAAAAGNLLAIQQDPELRLLLNSRNAHAEQASFGWDAIASLFDPLLRVIAATRSDRS
jgi:hypothetical protein